METARFDARFASRRTLAAVLVAAMAHVAVVALMLRDRSIQPGVSEPDATSKHVVEMRLLDLPPSPRRTSVSALPPTARFVAPARAAPVPAPSDWAPRAEVAVAASAPASAASSGLQLTLSPTALRALAAGGPKGLAESIAPWTAPASPLARLAGDGGAYSERRLPDGSIETHVHGECYVQVQSLAGQLDPIGHAHEGQVRACN
jgi:hypothetical protein